MRRSSTSEMTDRGKSSTLLMAVLVAIFASAVVASRESHSGALKGLDHYTLGQVYQQLGQNETAISEYEAAIKQSPDNEFAHLNLADIYAQMGRYEEAKLEYTRALRVNQADWRIYLRRGLLNQTNKHLDEAIQDYLEVVRIKPDNALAHYDLGTAFYENGEADKARTQYLQAIAYDPNFQPAQARLALLSPSPEPKHVR